MNRNQTTIRRWLSSMCAVLSVLVVGQVVVAQPCHDKWDASFGDPGPNGTVHALKAFDGSLYVGGDFDEVGSTTTGQVAEWDGTTWSAASNGLPSGATVIDLEVHDGALYALCQLYSPTMAIEVYKLDSGTWDDVTGDLSLETAFDMYSWASTGSLYISSDGGCNDGTPIWELQSNGDWDQVSASPNYGFAVWTMLGWEIDSNAVLLVGTNGDSLFQCTSGNADVDGGVLALNAGDWEYVGPNIDDWGDCNTQPEHGPAIPAARALEPFDGGVAAAGEHWWICNEIAYAGPVAVSTDADLSGWEAPGGEVAWGGVRSLKSLTWPGCDREQLYAGGHKMVPNGISASAIVKFEAGGGVWYEVDGGIPSPSNQNKKVLAMEVYKCALYVGGQFDDAGGNTVSNIARLTRCIGDWNNDGSVTSQDFIAFLNDYNASCPCADVNCDGQVNSLDYIAFLNSYNAGC